MPIGPFRRTPRAYRLLDLPRFFYIQRIKGFEPPTAPRMDPETIAFLEEAIRGARLYVEFGAGGSTIVADRLAVKTVTVESDRFYAATIRAAMTGSSVTILTPNIGVTGPWGWPLFQKPTSRRIKRWWRYVEAPFALGTPDLVLVDGRFRVACALESARRAQIAKVPATIVFDDYETRPQYKSVERHLGAPEMVGRAAVFRIVDQHVAEVRIEDAS